MRVVRGDEIPGEGREGSVVVTTGDEDSVSETDVSLGDTRGSTGSAEFNKVVGVSFRVASIITTKELVEGQSAIARRIERGVSASTIDDEVAKAVRGIEEVTVLIPTRFCKTRSTPGYIELGVKGTTTNGGVTDNGELKGDEGVMAVTISRTEIRGNTRDFPAVDGSEQVRVDFVRAVAVVSRGSHEALVNKDNRDRLNGRDILQTGEGVAPETKAKVRAGIAEAVSYTHLTLPTIYSV